MSRAFGAASAAAFIQPNVSIITFVMLDFASGIVRVHNGIGTYTWGGEDWVGVGDLGSVSQLEEGADVSPYGITLTLSALDEEISGIALNEDYFMRPVSIYIGALSADDELLNDPLQMWGGHMDVMSVSAGAENDVITVKCESELSAFDRSSNLKYTTQAQQELHPGDLFFSFLPKIEGAKIRWRDNKSDSIAGQAGQLVFGTGANFDVGNA
jgi:hypothetical protein